MEEESGELSQNPGGPIRILQFQSDFYKSDHSQTKGIDLTVSVHGPACTAWYRRDQDTDDVEPLQEEENKLAE